MPQRACDACHIRRIKCGGCTPCEPCRRNAWACTYELAPRKRGPKPRPVTDKIEAEKVKRRIVGRPVLESDSQPIGLDAVSGIRERIAPNLDITTWERGESESSRTSEADTSLISDQTLDEPLGFAGVFNATNDMEAFFTAITQESNLVRPAVTLSPIRHAHARSLNLLRSVFATSIDLFISHVYPLHPIVSQISLYERFRNGDHLVDTDFAALLCSIAATIHLLPDVSSDKAELGDDFHSFAVDLQKEGRGQKARGSDLPSLDQIAADMLIEGYAAAMGRVEKRETSMRKYVLLAQQLQGARERGELYYDQTENEIVTVMLWKAAVWDRSANLIKNQPLSYSPSIDCDAPFSNLTARRLRPITRLFQLVSPALSQCIVGGRCANSGPASPTPCVLDTTQAIAVQTAIASIWESEDLYPVQRADLQGTRAWLQVKIWAACVLHGLISPFALRAELCPTFPITILLQLDSMLKEISLSAFERNGQCMSFKLHAVADAAESVLRIPGGFILKGASTQADAEVALVNVRRLANQIGQKRWFRFV